MAVPSHHRPAAFTLVELLLASAFGVILLGGLMMMATSLLRAGLREDNQQSAQDAWARVNQFLNIEVGEAGRIYIRRTPWDPIALNQAPVCTGASQDGGSESFSIRVPNADPTAIAPFRTITYYVSGGNLMRCGPPVLANGTLDFTASNSEAILSYNTCLEVSDKKTCLKVSAPLNEPSLPLGLDHQNRSIGYRLRFFSAGSSAPEFSGVGRAWAQSSIIELED